MRLMPQSNDRSLSVGYICSIIKKTLKMLTNFCSMPMYTSDHRSSFTKGVIVSESEPK